MLGNTFGRLFRVTTVGESYGIGKGSGLAVIVDGVSPGLSYPTSSFRRRWINAGRAWAAQLAPAGN